MHNLHIIIFWLCVIIVAVVFGAKIYSLIKHHQARAKKSHRHILIEIFWATIPFIILIIIAIPATSFLLHMHQSHKEITRTTVQ